MILNVVKALWERHKRTEILRKQMRMTKRCSKELDILLGLIEYSCAVKPHVRSDGNRQSGTRKPLGASLLA